MKDELYGSGCGGGERRVVRGGWTTARPRTALRRPSVLSRVAGTRNFAAGAPCFGLWHVYFVMSMWPACDGSPLEQYAHDTALNRIIHRIEKGGAGTVAFATEVEVFAYAKRMRRTALIDAHRHMLVVEEHRQSVLVQAGARMNGEYLSLPPGVADERALWSQEREEICEWLVDRLGAEDAELLVMVQLDGFTVAEIARESGVAESTLRSRLVRAEMTLRASIAAEGGSRGTAGNN